MVHKGLINVDEIEESVDCVREKQECDLKRMESQYFGIRMSQRFKLLTKNLIRK